MSTLTAPPPDLVLPAPEADAEPATPGAPDSAPHQVHRVIPSSVEEGQESPLTGREVAEYVVMFVLGVLIIGVTLWFYGLFR